MVVERVLSAAAPRPDGLGEAVGAEDTPGCLAGAPPVPIPIATNDAPGAPAPGARAEAEITEMEASPGRPRRVSPPSKGRAGAPPLARHPTVAGAA